MTNPALPALESAAESDIGRVRKNNEDRYAVVAMNCGGIPGMLALVADGVGGHAAGEVASQTVVDVITRELNANPCDDPVRALPQAVILAGREVFAQAKKDPAKHGMATTIAAAWVIADRLYTATVGDSRIYLQRGGRVVQASIDHTWVEEAIEHGILTPEQARNHPNAHVLRRHLGGEGDPVPDQRMRLAPGDSTSISAAHQGMQLEEDDAVILCSDGLSDLVTAEEIGRALQGRPLAKTVHDLVELACSRGGHDNITVVALRKPARTAAPAGRKAKSLYAVWMGWLLALAILAGLAVLVAIVARWI